MSMDLVLYLLLFPDILYYTETKKFRHDISIF